MLFFGIGTNAFAAPVNSNGAPAQGDTATVTVNNVEAGATVTAYQIVKANYDTTGFTGYTALATVADALKPTNAEVVAIANGSLTGLPSQTLTYDGTTQSYKADLTPGYWVIIANGTGTVMYNPMLAGVYYTGADNTMIGGTIDASTQWSLNNETLYAKKTDKPTVDKKVLSDITSGNENGNDLAIGDKVEFEITTELPSYSRDYLNAKFDIKDTMSTGLTLDQNSIKVTVVGDDAAGNYTLVTTENGYTISFNSDYLYDKPVRKVVVTYSATLNEKATTNFVENTNEVTIEYSNNPTDDTSYGTDSDKTYHYTFEIDGMFDGKTESTEVWKSGEKTTTKNTPLAGATFTLTNTATNKVYTATSDDRGRLNFKGLDAGTYTLKETVAPTGYSLNTKEYPVVITAEYNNDGTLKSYSIKIDGQNTSTYTATYENNTKTVTPVVNPIEIPNTKLDELPSTGGMGTFIFTIVGVSLMAFAVIVTLKNKKEVSK